MVPVPPADMKAGFFSPYIIVPKKSGGLRQDGGTTETVSEAPGAYGGCGGSHTAGAAPYETASTLAPWPSPEVGMAERHAAGPSHSSLPWSDLSFLRAGVPLEQVSRHAVVYTDASAKGWAATFNGLAVSGVWTGPQLHWHINCLELLVVHLALNCLKRRLRGEHVLVRTNSTVTVAYINRQGGLCSRRMLQLARHLLLWSRKHLRSLRAIHILGLLNRTADELSRAALPGEWRLHPQTVQLIWQHFGLAQVDLFASLETSHCQLFYSLTEGTLSMDWHTAGRWAFASMHFPQWAFSHRHCARSGRKRSRSCSWRHTGPPRLGSQSWCSSWQPLPGRFLWGRIYSQRQGTRIQTSGNFMSGPWMGRGGSRWPTPRGSLHHHFGENCLREMLTAWSWTCSSSGDLLTEKTPGSARSESYCRFCSNGWSEGCLPPSLNAYVAMIAANHDPVDGKLVGKHAWFLRGARRLNPPQPPSIPSWDLSLVLRALQQHQFEPCKQSSWSFSQNENSTPACTNLHQEGWGPACIFCRRFMPKVWTGGFPDNPEAPAPARLCAQGSHFSLRGPSGEPASAAPGGGRPSPSFACPVRALTCYVDKTRSLRTSDQLLSVTEAGRKGMPSPSRGWPTG